VAMLWLLLASFGARTGASRCIGGMTVPSDSFFCSLLAEAGRGGVDSMEKKQVYIVDSAKGIEVGQVWVSTSALLCCPLESAGVERSTSVDRVMVRRGIVVGIVTGEQLAALDLADMHRQVVTTADDRRSFALRGMYLARRARDVSQETTHRRC